MGVLRLLLALSVVNAHGYDLSGNNLFGFPMLLPDLAVQTFYMISGFYMALVLHEKYQPGNATYLEFITNRFLRIFPSYFVVLLLTIIVLAIGWHYGMQHRNFMLWSQNWLQLDWTAKFFLVFSHAALFGQDAYLFLALDKNGTLYFDPDFSTHNNEFWEFMLIPQAWSLSLELCFYLLAPFLVRRSAALLALMIVASLTIRIALIFWLGYKNDPWAYRFFPSELALFLCGAAAYRVYRALLTGKMDVKTWIGWSALGIVASIALLVSRYPGETVIWLNVSFVVAVILIMPFLFKFTRRSKIDHFAGELSYPIYLCHMLVIWLFALMQIPQGIELSVSILLATLLLSIILYWGIDRNVDQFRHQKFAAAHTRNSEDRKKS